MIDAIDANEISEGRQLVGVVPLELQVHLIDLQMITNDK